MTVIKPGNARLLARLGKGVPERKKRGPIAVPPGIAPPGLSTVLKPLSAFCPPDEANVAYVIARVTRGTFPLANSPVINATCAAVKFVYVVLNGRTGNGVPGPTVRLEVKPLATFDVKKPEARVTPDDFSNRLPGFYCIS